MPTASYGTANHSYGYRSAPLVSNLPNATCTYTLTLLTEHDACEDSRTWGCYIKVLHGGGMCRNLASGYHQFHSSPEIKTSLAIKLCHFTVHT